MSPSPVGSAADEMSRTRAPLAPRADPDDSLLDAIRRNLGPGDPVARLLALWPRPVVAAVGTAPDRTGWLPGSA